MASAFSQLHFRLDALPDGSARLEAVYREGEAIRVDAVKVMILLVIPVFIIISSSLSRNTILHRQAQKVSLSLFLHALPASA